MGRQTVTLVVGLTAAAVAVALIVVLASSRTPAASQSPGLAPSTTSPSPGAVPSGASTVAPTPIPPPSPTEAAGPPQLAWELIDALDEDAGVHGVAFIDGRWFALGDVGRDGAIWFSDDGATWTRSEIAATHGEFERTTATDVVALDGALIAIGSWGAQQTDQFAWAIWRSTDGGMSWSEERADQPFALRAVTEGGPGLVGAGWDYAGTTPFDSWMSLTSDGGSWERVNSEALTDSEVRALVALGDRLVAVGSRWTGEAHVPSAWISDDAGGTWRQVQPSSLADDGQGVMNDIAVFGDGLIAVGRTGDIQGGSPVAWVSADGETWQPELMGEAAVANSIAVLDGGVVAVGNGSGADPGPERAWTSADGFLWTESGPLDAGNGIRQLAGVAAADGVVVATVLCWTDGCGPAVWRGEVVGGN